MQPYRLSTRPCYRTTSGDRDCSRWLSLGSIGSSFNQVKHNSLNSLNQDFDSHRTETRNVGHVAIFEVTQEMVAPQELFQLALAHNRQIKCRVVVALFSSVAAWSDEAPQEGGSNSEEYFNLQTSHVRSSVVAASVAHPWSRLSDGCIMEFSSSQ